MLNGLASYPGEGEGVGGHQLDGQLGYRPYLLLHHSLNILCCTVDFICVSPISTFQCYFIKVEAAWPSGYGAGLEIQRSRVQVPL